MRVFTKLGAAAAWVVVDENKVWEAWLWNATHRAPTSMHQEGYRWVVVAEQEEGAQDIEDMRTECRGLFAAFKQHNPAATEDVVVDALNELLDAVVGASEEAGHGKAGMDDVLSMAKEEARRVGPGAHSIKPYLNNDGFLKWQL